MGSCQDPAELCFVIVLPGSLEPIWARAGSEDNNGQLFQVVTGKNEKKLGEFTFCNRRGGIPGYECEEEFDLLGRRKDMYNVSIWCPSGDTRLDNQSRINWKYRQ